MSHNLATCRPCRKIYKLALQKKVCRKTVGCSWSKLPGARAIPRRWGRGWSWTRWALGHFEKPKFWFLVLHSVFPIIWSIWSPSVAFLAESIKYVDLPHPALKFSCVNIDEDGGTVHWDGPVCAFFFENPLSHPLSDAFCNAVHDEIEIYIFAKRVWPPRPHLWSNNNMGGQK